MESDGDDSDGATRKMKDDEFELPRVMWVPDKAENQEDFLRRNKTHESFQPVPCTQTTESSRLLRNSFECHQRNDSVTSTSSTSTTTFNPGVLDSTLSGRRPTRRIRSLPSPYSASCSNTNSSRRSTVSGVSSSRTESAPLSTTSARHLNVYNTSSSTGQSNTGSPGPDSLGFLMTQLGERFSRRNEARKKRAEMQEKVTSGKEQMDASRMQQTGKENRNGYGQQEDMRAPQLRKPSAFNQINQPLTKQLLEPHSSRQHIPSIKVTSGSVTEVHQKPHRHPLANEDANQHTNTTISPMRPTETWSAQKRQKIGQSSFNAVGETNSMQKATVVQQNSIQYAHQAQAIQYQPFTRKSANQSNSLNRPVIPAHLLTTGFRQQAPVSLPKPIVVASPAVAEADNDIGQHHKSDTSFESLNDMDGLFSGGGEEVEALFRACDGF